MLTPEKLWWENHPSSEGGTGQDLTEFAFRKGSIQLTSYRLLLFSDHPNLEPRHFVDEKVVNENHKDFMFLECILFITEVRFVPEGSAPDIRQAVLAVVFSSSLACSRGGARKIHCCV